MTSNQIAYQKLEEDKRHNRVTEEVEMGKAIISAYEARTKAEVGQSQAVNYLSGAYASILNAQTNQGQVLVNAYDAATRRMVGQSNVFANYLGGISQLYNAETNRLNAETNRMNAQTLQGELYIDYLNYGLNVANLQRQITADNRNWIMANRNYSLSELTANRNWALDLNQQNMKAEEIKFTHEENVTRNFITLINGVFGTVGSALGGIAGNAIRAGLIG